MKGGSGFQRHPPQQGREDTHINKGEKAMQTESNSQPEDGSDEEEGRSWSEIEETGKLALVAIHDDKASFDANFQVPHQLSLNENAFNPRSLIYDMHNSLLRESKKIHSMHSNLLSLETQVNQLKCIGLKLENRPIRVRKSEILENITHLLEPQTQNHGSQSIQHEGINLKCQCSSHTQKTQNLDNLDPRFHLQENNYPTHIDYKMNRTQFFNKGKFRQYLSNHV